MKRLLLLALLLAPPARAGVTLGAVLSLTGPGAGLGIPARNIIELLPKTMASEPVRWVVLDDGRDPTVTVRPVRKLVEERVQSLAGRESVFSLSHADHSGAEPGSQVLIEIRGGGYHLVPS